MTAASSCLWVGEEMMKFWERRIACGWGHEKVLGLGHTLRGDWRVEEKRRERMRRERERREREMGLGLVMLEIICFWWSVLWSL